MKSINRKKKRPGIIVRILEDAIQRIESQIHEQRRILVYKPGEFMHPSNKIKYPDMDKTAEINILICEIKIEFLKALRSVFSGKPIERRKIK